MKSATMTGQTWAKEQGYSAGTAWGESVYFRYEIDNRSFSAYPSKVEASLWKGGEKGIDLFDKDIAIPPLDKATVNRTLSVRSLRRPVWTLVARP